MKISMLTMESFNNRALNSVGSSRIRGRWIVNNWKECDEYRIGENPDVMIYQKAYWKEHMENFKGIKIFDLCDPDWLTGSPIKEVSQYMDAFVVPTEPLKVALEQFIDKPVFVIPDRFDLTEFPEPKLTHTSKGISAFWYGYSQNAYVLEKAASSLRELNMNLTVYSDKATNIGDQWVKYEYDEIHHNMKKHDMALLPKGNDDDAIFKFKSNNKTVECQLMGLPIAVTYDDIVKFQDPTERTKEAKANYERAIIDYDIKLSVDQWKKVIQRLK